MNRREFFKISTTAFLKKDIDVEVKKEYQKPDEATMHLRLYAVLLLALSLVASRNPLVQDFFQKLEDLVIRPEKNEE